MPQYIILAKFTDQGVRGTKESPKRADDFAAMAKKAGGTVTQLYWTLGSYDVVAIVDAPDVEKINALGLSVVKLGNVRTETLRSFDKAEMAAILKKVT